jgi:hypothetical protein
MIPSGFQNFDPSATINNTCAAPLIGPNGDQQRMVSIINEEGDFAELSDIEKYNYKKTVFAELWFNNELMNKGTDYDHVLQAFYDEMLETPMGQLFVLGGIIETDPGEATNLISTISPRNKPEENEIAVDGIYLTTWAKGDFELSQDQKDLLYEIAIQNPATGGDAVYSARVMLELLVDDISDEGTSNRKSSNAFSFKKYHEVKLYPNPATDFIYCEVRFSDHEKGKLDIFDGYGKLIQTKKLMHGYNDIQLNTQQLNNGIYFIRVVSDDAYTFNGKIIISK